MGHNIQHTNYTHHVISRRHAVQLLAGATLSAAFGRSFAQPQLAQAKTKSKVYYDIIYNLNGGKNPKGQRARILKGKSVKVSKLLVPKRTGYTFMGWYTTAKFKTLAVRVYGQKKASKRRLWAKWQVKTYKIKYEFNGGTAHASQQYTYTIEDETFKLKKPTWPAYEFLGWFTEPTFENQVTKIKKGSTGTKYFYAQWQFASYWKEHLEEQCAAANALKLAAGEESDQFVFITDAHWPSNAKGSPELIKRVLEATQAERLVFGGDLLNKCETKEAALEMLQGWKEQMSFADLYFVRGNHDTNYNVGEYDEAVVVPDEELVSLFHAPMGLEMEGDGECECGLYYHFDIDERRIRYIVMDTGGQDAYVAEASQIAWMQQRILELANAEEQWTVLVLAHQFFTSTLVESDDATDIKFDGNGKAIKKGLDEIYDEALEGGVVIAGCLTGHVHFDWASYSEKGYPMISTICDAKRTSSLVEQGLDSPVRSKGNITEQAFDIVTVDTAARRLYFTRFGAGASRRYSY